MADESYSGIALQIYALVDVPTGLSGGNLLSLIDRSRLQVLSRTGLDPGSPAIPDRFKSAVIDLTLSQVWSFKASEGISQAIDVGDFSVSPGGANNSANTAANFWLDQAAKELKTIGRGPRYGRTY